MDRDNVRCDGPAPAEGTRLGLAALILLLAGWLVAVLFADGLELYRSAAAMPLLAAAGVCALADSLRTGRVVWLPGLAVGTLALLYFAARAAASPVWDLGRYDLYLAAGAWITVATVASCAGTTRRAGFLVAAMAIVFAGHFAAGLYQRYADHEWSLLRFARRTEGGVSGLFWHRNNLAAFLAIALPVFLGLALSVRRAGPRTLFFLLVAAGLGLAYLSKSRAGFAAVVAGLGATGAVLLLWRSRSWSWSARLATWSGAGLAAVAAAIAVFLVASKVSGDRGHGTDLSRALDKSSRLALAGVAFDIWMDAPLVGNGSQSYRYLVVKNWDHESLPVWLNNPETVHNEYLQVLADYGLAGFGLVMAFLLVIVGRIVVAPQKEDPPPLVQGVRLGAAGGLVGTAVHAAVDFQLHLLPILLLASVAAGALLQSATPAGWTVRGWNALTVFAAVIMLVVAVGRECLSFPGWLGWQREIVRGAGQLPASRLGKLRDLVEASPHYEAALHYARLRYDQAWQNPEPDRSLLEEASRALAIATERNRFDQTALVTHALVLDQLGRFEEAAPVHVRAVEMAAARENKYGAMAGLAQHLMARGEALFMTRRPAEAFGCFLLARQYLETSRARLFKFEGDGGYASPKEFVDERIKLLQAAGIQPQPPAEIPPPPETL